MIDETVQRWVDEAAFTVMRLFGVGRSVIRYTLGAIIVLANVASIVIPNSGVPIPQKVILALFSGLYLNLMHTRNRRDLEAERRGMQAQLERGSGGHWKVIWLGFTIIDLCRMWHPLFVTKGMNLSMAAFYHGMQALTCFCLLLLAYLDRTPNQPPPAKQRVGQRALVPIPVRSR